MGFWEDVGRPLVTPQADYLYRQASSVDEALKQYDVAYAALRNHINQGRQAAIDRSYDELARTGNLNSTSIAKAVGLINMNAEQELANARAMAEMERASARARKAELGEMAKAATVSDAVNLGKEVVGAGLIAGGMGAFGGTTTKTIPGEASNKFRSGFKPDSVVTTPTYTPWMTAVGENLAGVQGGPFTKYATEQANPGYTNYADLYKRGGSQYATGYQIPSYEELLKRYGYDKNSWGW